MKKASKWIIASVGGIALISTLAVAGPGFRDRGPGMFGDWMIERMTDNLELNETQVENLQGVKDAIKTARDKLRENRKDKGDEILALLEQPTLDQEKAMALLTERGDAMKEQAPKVIAAIAGFYDSLTPQQQQTLRETIKEKMEWREKCGPKKRGPGRGNASFDMPEKGPGEFRDAHYPHHSDKAYGLPM
jgi:Spy/CpxP family protein refolding chaperone